VPLSSDDFRARIAASKAKLEADRPSTPAPQPPAPTLELSTPRGRKQKAIQRATGTGAPVDIHAGPPHANEAEQAVLAAMMQYPDQCVPEARRELTRAHFYNPINAELFDVMLARYDAGTVEKPWLIPLTIYLRDAKRLDALGGAFYITSLFTTGIAQSSVPWYAQILREKFVLRELIALGTKLVRASYGAIDDEVGDILDDFSRWLDRVKYDNAGLNGSDPQRIEVLHAFNARGDPNSLIGRRWLVRGGTSLWAGGSGYGKSALQMQLAIYWGCGRECFGMHPGRPMRSLILQAENDLGDMAEQFQGVYAGIAATQDFNLEECKALIEKNVIIHRIVGKTGAAFLALADGLIQQTRCDMLWIDPLFAFAGCDLLNPEKTGRFLREGLFPIIVKRNVACHVLHHVGKPVRDKDESVTPMSEIDYQYLGFGTSEIQNAFRAVNVLVPIAHSGVYKLVLSKRGQRAGAKDIEGNFTQTLFLEHSREGICWLPCSAPDGEGGGKGRPATFKLEDVLAEMSVMHPLKTGTLCKRLREERNMSRSTFFELWDQGKQAGRIVPGGEGGWVRKDGGINAEQ
jgi:hypothetical protein